MQQPILNFQDYFFSQTHVQLAVPDFEEIQRFYVLDKRESDFPYWAKIWPSAVALTEFLQQNIAYIQHKNVLELAAGIGLPSLFSAAYASHVCCSDYLPDAVKLLQQNIQLNQLKNVNAQLLNWQLLPDNLEADVLLLSDINYHPAAFEVLYQVMKRFLEKGSTIILSTPQRLVAKDFIAQLLPWCVVNEELTVDELAGPVLINVFVLQQLNVDANR